MCINSLVPEGKKILIANNGAYSSRAVEICKYYGIDHIDLKQDILHPVCVAEVEKALQERGIIYHE